MPSTIVPGAARVSAPEDVHRINLSWIVRLRWVAAAVQAALVTLGYLGFEMLLSLGVLGMVIGITVASNLVAVGWLRARRPVTEMGLAGILALDVGLLTVILYATGGPANPFCLLYMVHIALAALVLRGSLSLGVATLAAACYGLLFVVHEGWRGEQQHLDMALHLQGMWVAVAVSGALVAWFIHKIRVALARREEELGELRRARARSDKLASLATMAAGAAHELATPLGTIAVASRELQRALGDEDGLGEDATLIRREVDRCRDILGRLSTRSGQSPGEVERRVPVAELLAAIAARCEGRGLLEVRNHVDGATLTLPRQAVVEAIGSLVDNAHHASPEGAPVILTASSDGEDVVFEVRDRGWGMSLELLERVGEPFFTTKAPGRGMGLGVYVARSLMEQLGGRLDLSSVEGQGTTATVRLPLADEGES